jgi:hypothetical protein
MFQTKVVEDQNTHFKVIIPPAPLENLGFYEIVWEKVVEPGRPQMTV